MRYGGSSRCWPFCRPVFAREPARVAPASRRRRLPRRPPAARQRLEVRGVVYASDGRTPVARASVYVYQTDARGYRPDDARGTATPG